MVRYVEVFSAAEDDNVVRVEIDEPDGLVEVGRGGGVAARASTSIEAMTDKIRPIARGVAQSFRDAADAPDEVQVTFGIAFSSEADVVISRASAEASFQVTLTWNRVGDVPAPGPAGLPG